MIPILRAALAAVLLLMMAPAAARAQNSGGITVLAAASLTDVLENIGRSYEATTHRRVVFSFAGSMTLAKQIEASTGADMFVSADVQSMDYLDAGGFIARDTRRNLVRNSLVLIAPKGSRVQLTLQSGVNIANALGDGRLALANPESVPAGRYGRDALMALGAWDGVQNHLALGEDVRTTLAYVARGEAPLGIVYGTDARIDPDVRVVAAFPENTHEPIVYPAALTKEARAEAAAFLDYLGGGRARAAFERAGFAVFPSP
jgi:molybdate transport system substrate-binding protein